MPVYKMKGKKDGLQKYRVRINYTDQHGGQKQIDRVAYGAENAKALEYALNQEVKSQAHTSSSMTVGGLYEEYLSAKRHEVRESTLLKAAQVLRLHILPTLQDCRLQKLNVQLLQKWKMDIEGKGLSVTMRNNIYGAFRSMLNYAVKMEYVPSNPLNKIGNFKDAYAAKKEMDFYTPDEFKLYISAAKKQAEEKGFYEWNYYVFFCIAFYTGLRKGEIHALKWTDIDHHILHVRRSICQKLKGADRETPPKNKTSVRDLQLPSPLINILNDHYSRYHAVDGFSADWRVCGGPTCLRDTSVNNRNLLYSGLAGLKTIRIHDFRHSHASLLANEGINIQEIARRLGHAKIEITWNTYAHLYPREEERAVSILNKIE